MDNIHFGKKERIQCIDGSRKKFYETSKKKVKKKSEVRKYRNYIELVEDKRKYDEGYVCTKTSTTRKKKER